MSPAAAKRTDPASAHTVLPVSVPALAALLDLPAGINVVSAVVEGDALLLTLAGVDWAGVRGHKAKRGAKTPERITADYTVDAHGHRSLTSLVAIDDGPAGGDTDNSTTNPPNEKE